MYKIKINKNNLGYALIQIPQMMKSLDDWVRKRGLTKDHTSCKTAWKLSLTKSTKFDKHVGENRFKSCQNM